MGALYWIRGARHGSLFCFNEDSMNLKIAHLMQARGAERDLHWLRAALQSAIEVELSTLPPYLCGYWAFEDRSSYPSKAIRTIVFQEMAHLGLACNMRRAVGGRPDI